MSKLKFRLWEVELKSMITNEGGGQFLIGLDGRVFDTSTTFTHQISHCNNMVIMQCTGLKDKNGLDIYEGDIIKSNCYPFYSDGLRVEVGKAEPVELNYLGVVSVDADGVFYDAKAVSDRVSGLAIGGQVSELDDIDVVGNIYENPELVGGL